MARVALFVPDPSEGANDATRAQINYIINMLDKSYVIIIIITTQGQTLQNFEHFIDRSFLRAKW